MNKKVSNKIHSIFMNCLSEEKDKGLEVHGILNPRLSVLLNENKLKKYEKEIYKLLLKTDINYRKQEGYSFAFFNYNNKTREFMFDPNIAQELFILGYSLGYMEIINKSIKEWMFMPYGVPLVRFNTTKKENKE